MRSYVILKNITIRTVKFTHAFHYSIKFILSKSNIIYFPLQPALSQQKTDMKHSRCTYHRYIVCWNIETTEIAIEYF